MSAPQINTKTFFQHHENLLKKWKENFSNIDCLIILNGKDDGQKKAKTTAMNVWYFGYDFLDTLLVILKNEIILVASEKKMKLVKDFPEEAKKRNFKFELISKDPKDNQQSFEQILAKIKDSTTHSKPVIGNITAETQQGSFADEYYKFFQNNSEVKIENCAPLFQEVLAIKDSDEIDFVKKAGKISTYLEAKLIEEIEGIIDKEEKVKQYLVSKKLTDLLDNEAQSKKIAKKCNVDVNCLDFAYDPLIQSDTIVTAIGVHYHQYNVNIARTLFIDPTEDQKNLYIGLELAEDILTIAPSCDRIVQDGMVFNILLILKDLPSDKKKYAIFIIQKSGGVLCLTNDVSRKYEEVSYNLDGDEEEDNVKEEDDGGDDENGEEDTQQKKQKKSSNHVSQQPSTRKTRGTHLFNENASNEQRRKEHQKQLQELKEDELKDRLKNDGFRSNAKQNQNLQLSSLQCYKSTSDFPEGVKKNQIYVDSKKFCILCPINGHHVPFHIALIKNISKIDEVKTSALRINLNFPTTAITVGNLTFPKITDPENGYIKELTFRSKNLEKYNELIKKVKELQKNFKLKMQEKQNADVYVEQAKLDQIRGKRPTLKDLKVRPALSNKKTSGTLECHQNGFRYHTNKGENVDIIFANIKHYLFQPCDQEIIICVHFHLFSPLTINKKKTHDIQFYMEAGLPPEDLVDRRRRGADDFDEEEQEKIQRKKLNKEFKGFIAAVAELHPHITFDKPFRKLGFYGSPARSNLFLQPTLNALINITDTPFFVVTLKEIELCCFERMMGGLKNFDLVFVMKDYDKPITSFVEEGGWRPVLEESEDEEEEQIDEDSEFDVSEEGSELEEDDDSEFSDEEGDDDDDFDEDSGSGGGDEDLSESGNDWSELEEKAHRADEERRQEKMRQQRAPQKRSGDPKKKKR